MKDFLQSSSFSRMISVLGILLAALVIFWAGTAVGYRQAEFSYRWSNHYTDVFGGGSPFAFRPDADDLAAANGAAGKVVAVNLPQVTVKNPDQAEKVILISPATVIRRLHAVATTTDIRPGDVLIAIGSPDAEGRIVATFVRLMPPPPTDASGTPERPPMPMTP
jgi:hypothetical protein